MVCLSHLSGLVRKLKVLAKKIIGGRHAARKATDLDLAVEKEK